MYYRHHAGRTACLFTVLLLLSAAGCSGKEQTEYNSVSADSSAGTEVSAPVIYEPEAPQTKVLGTDTLVIDVSNASQGYIMAKYTGDADKVNIQITGPDNVDYKYFLTPSDSFTSFPLTCGNGNYRIDGYEHVADNKYSVLFHETTEVLLENELLPFLYPSQYVSFSPESAAVSRAADITSGASSELDAVADIYNYIIEHVAYDEEKARTVSSGYLPDVDETLETGKGICFDYAALTTAMLRSRNIPTRLETGYSQDIYHAWISVYTKETGWIDKAIEFTANGWTRMDPTVASGNSSIRPVAEYVADNSNYTTLYIH